MMYPRPLPLALAAFCLLLVSSRVNAQVLLNGGFENPRVTAGTITSTVPTSWTDSSDKLVSNGNGTLGNTPYGTQFLELTPGHALAQTITGFTANAIYVLGFDFAFESGIEADPFTVSISGAATTGSSFALTGAGSYGNGTIPFQSNAIIFAASSSGSATFTFSDLGAQVALDNVALFGGVVTPPPTPEPSTYAEMLVGLAALAGFGLMRRKSARA